MSCCCRSKNGSSNAETGRSRGSAPSHQSMQDRDAVNADKQAVNWWREKQQSKDEGDTFTPSTNRNENPALARNSSRTTSLEQSQSRMEQRNSLQKPYAIDREKPLNPRNGDVIQPSLAGVQAAQPGTPSFRTTTHDEKTSASKMEIFRPEISGSDMSPTPLGEVSSSGTQSIFRNVRQGGDQSSERITTIEPVGSEDYLDTSAKRHPDPSAKYVHKASLKLAPPDDEKRKSDKLPQKNRQRSIPQLRKQSRQKRGSDRKAKSTHNNKYDDGNLSDVPSDVDSVTKERYLLACQMLKTTLMMKEKSLEPLEREFILSLLGDSEDPFSEDQVSAVEQATLRLESDPIFQNSDTNLSRVRSREKAPPPSPMAAATIQRREKSAVGRTSSTKDPNKHPHTATRAKPRGKRSFLKNPCNPRSIDDIDTPADIVLLVREEDDLDHQGSSDESDTDGHENVRFDGWSNHKAAEYPFRILGADDSQLKPRVLTPSIMEAFQGFLPYVISESNFWLKYSLVGDGASLATLLSCIRTSTHTIIGIETNEGEVFGSFTGTPWRAGTRWFGTGEAFLWRLKKSRFTSPKNASRSNFENEMEVYPYTGDDELVQYCTSKTIAVGGGDWIGNPCPFQDEPRGIGFMIDGDLAGGETNSCATFGNPRLCRKISASSEFSISNLEVWTLTPCVNVRDAAKMEVQKLFIEENYQ
jgi:hypothetical protein